MNAQRQQVATAVLTPPMMPPSYPKARRIRFNFDGDDSYGKYFANNDMVLSHFLAGLSGGFPPGEESFIRSVRRFADELTEPALKKRVAGFIGQESTHGLEHRRLNDRLIEHGYPIAWHDSKKFRDRMLRAEQRLPPQVHLALTAALEHYTAVLAQRILSSDEIQSIPGTPEVWHLLNWHAVEELEHKSVAFDVYRTIGGSERLRIVVMSLLIAFTIPLTTLELAISLARDPVARRRPIRVAREVYRLYRGPYLKGSFREAAKYLRTGFHPDDIDTAALLQHWQLELFGSDGVLVDHLR